jgi:hypothetical protein
MAELVDYEIEQIPPGSVIFVLSSNIKSNALITTSQLADHVRANIFTPRNIIRTGQDHMKFSHVMMSLGNGKAFESTPTFPDNATFKNKFKYIFTTSDKSVREVLLKDVLSGVKEVKVMVPNIPLSSDCVETLKANTQKLVDNSYGFINTMTWITALIVMAVASIFIGGLIIDDIVGGFKEYKHGFNSLEFWWIAIRQTTIAAVLIYLLFLCGKIMKSSLSKTSQKNISDVKAMNKKCQRVLGRIESKVTSKLVKELIAKVRSLVVRTSSWLIKNEGSVVCSQLVHQLMEYTDKRLCRKISLLNQIISPGILSREVDDSGRYHEGKINAAR